VREKQSLIASGIDSYSGPLTPPLPILVASPDLLGRVDLRGELMLAAELTSAAAVHDAQALSDGEGLLHDTRNLVGALGLYCDLLSMPDVLKPQHRHYAEEVRQLGARSGALIQHIMERGSPGPHAPDKTPGGAADGSSLLARDRSPAWAGRVKSRVLEDSRSMAKPVSLRAILERCSGLLSSVAGGRAIEVSYGPASTMPIGVSEEAVERILVNLVRNSASALSGRELSAEQAGERGGLRSWEMIAGGEMVSTSVRETIADPTSDDTPGAIRIGVGLLINRVGDQRPWPFRRVRLVVEDSGCGMSPEHLERLLCGGRAASRGCHGIGFRVVQELVAASNGDIRAMSAPFIGTRIQIEWPIAGIRTAEAASGPGVARQAPHAKVPAGFSVLRRDSGQRSLAVLSGKAAPGEIPCEPHFETQQGSHMKLEIGSRRCGDPRQGVGRWI
jgi:signal transduction histidine kinase